MSLQDVLLTEIENFLNQHGSYRYQVEYTYDRVGLHVEFDGESITVTDEMGFYTYKSVREIAVPILEHIEPDLELKILGSLKK